LTGGSGIIAEAAKKGVSKEEMRSCEEAMAALTSERRLKKDGADREPKTCPTGIMTYAVKTYAKTGARSG
jgi:hypothetical protein